MGDYEVLAEGGQVKRPWLITSMALLLAGGLAACTINVPSTAPSTVTVVPTTPPPVTVTAEPEGPSSPSRPQGQATVTVTPAPTVTITREPPRSDFANWLCFTPASALPAIVPGESSNSVRLLQWALTQVGYYNAAIGGNYRTETRAATSRFQLDNGLGGSGNVSTNTWGWLQWYVCP